MNMQNRQESPASYSSECDLPAPKRTSERKATFTFQKVLSLSNVGEEKSAVPKMAAKLAEQLEKRRRTNSSWNSEEEDAASADHFPTNASSQHSPVRVKSKEASTGFDAAFFAEAITLLRRDVLTEVQELHMKMDKVINHVEDSCAFWLKGGFNGSGSSSGSPELGSPLCMPRTLHRDSVEKDLYDADPACKYGKSSNLIAEHAHGINIAPSPPAKPSMYNDEKIEHAAPLDPDTPTRLPKLRRQESRTSSCSSCSSTIWARFDPMYFGGVMTRARHRGAFARIAWLYLEDPQLVPSGRLYHRIMALLVVASCLLMTVQTMQSPPFAHFTEKVLHFAVDGLLTIEILLRFAVCPNRISFWVDQHNLLDMLNGPLTLAARVMLPYFIKDDGGTEGRVSTIMNSCLPVLRLLKLLRRFEGAHLIYAALDRASEALPVLVYVLLVILTTFASILYAIEPMSNIGSLPEAWWLAVVTLSTVGYGDVTPVTPDGKLVVGILIVIAALYMAMPLGVVGKIFADVWENRNAILLTKLARRRLQIAGYTAKDIPAMFFSFDKNKDGVLSMEEFTDMMKQMQFDTSGARASELFKVFDTDAGGNIDDREFLSTLFPESIADIYGTDACAASTEPVAAAAIDDPELTCDGLATMSEHL